MLLIFTACMTLAPTQCATTKVETTFATVQACEIGSIPLMASLVFAHPGYQLERYHCEDSKTRDS